MDAVGNGPCAMHNVSSRGDQRNPQRDDSGEGWPVRQRPARLLALSGLAGAMMIFSGTFGGAPAATRGANPPIAKSACSVRPAVTTAFAPAASGQPATLDSITSVRLVSATATRLAGHHRVPSKSATPSTSPTASTSPTTTATPTPSTSPSTTATPTPKQTPAPSTTATPSTSPTPSKSPTPSTSPTPSKSPSPSPSPSGGKTAKLCVSVQPFSSGSVRPGKTATYAIWVWSTGAAGQGVTVKAAVGHVAHVSAARFTVCPTARGSVCTIGALPTGQADELQAAVKVASAASPGAKVTLTATASGTHASSFHAAATMVIAAPPSSPAPSGSTPPALPVTPPLPVTPALPAVPNVGTLPGIGTSAQNPASLFPTVSPSASATPNSAGTGPAARRQHRVNAVATSATLPLDPRLIGGQLAGLAVLAGAIAIAIARLSLRSPKPQAGKSAGE